MFSLNAKFQPVSVALLLGLLGLLGSLGGCKRSPPDASAHAQLACSPVQTLPVNKKVLIDRTTALPQNQIERLLVQAQGWLQPGDHVQVFHFGGVNPSLVEALADIQMPLVGHPEALAKERWSRAPAELERERLCYEERRVAATRQLGETLTAALQQTDLRPEGLSPVVEAVHAITSDWVAPDKRLILLSDGMQNYSTSRSFYAPNQKIRVPTPNAWLKQLQAEALLPALGGAKVTHLALSLTEWPAHTVRQLPTQQPAPVNPQDDRSLRAFEDAQQLRQTWAAYWAAAGAADVRFGQPLVTGPL